MSEKVLYNGKWHDRQHFRVWLYRKDGSKRLVNSYDEYEAAIFEGGWHDNPVNFEKPAEEESAPVKKKGRPKKKV